ncbi:E3 ubiquitin-protein ligase makorin-2-like [Anopheles funestus]|uniref:E3 ubiquitin-protein ligase makorin-2-like n=1 Tax=Anopheles funestus TaxID=62324 RepID=UPI0020C5EEE8|nr:E3 ubiquitin-protein ligase makorin-2-like [Anopheles funestus]XP_049295641.1 E3 ubiquitin-protein ligase makorin-2-like [Anopheles funestus]XP_049295649.1 E3 ubiquitin-protein ligase makorin-2-like [Anopheles funestus]
MEKGKDGVMPVVAPLDNAAAAQIVCRFYQYGTCRFGSTCRFIHPVPEPSGTHGSSCSSSSSSNSSFVTATTSPTDVVHTQTDAKEETVSDTKLKSYTSDLSRWIDAPIFVPKSQLTGQPRRQQRKSVDEKKVTKAENDEEEDEDDEEEEEEEPDLDDDERNNEADNEADNEEEEEEESGAVGYAQSSLMSYANVVTMNNNHNGKDMKRTPGQREFCLQHEKFGKCLVTGCQFVHGELCELCEKYCLDPEDKEQQRKHNVDCIREHELEMEHAFAVQRSRDKTCGICLEVVMEKRAREQRFGILPNCKHTFCLGCIRTWRKATNFANKIKRSCPTCRIPSDFVCPSFVWVECGEEKDRLIENYKQACNNTDCMHFKKGTANCPFGNKCFYRHALPSGELVDLGAPSRRRNPHRGRDRDMDHADTLQLQEIFATLLAPRSWVLEEYMMSLFSELEESDDDLEFFSGRGGGFPSDDSDYTDYF